MEERESEQEPTEDDESELKHTENCENEAQHSEEEDQRQILNTNFWRLSTKERKAFILNTCSRLEVKRRTTESVRKQNTFKYKLKTANGQMVEVCKTFFLTTLGYKKTNDRVVHDTLKKTPNNQLYPQADRRTQSAKKKIDYDSVDAHIESFQPSISRYRREHAPNRRYLPSDISISVMFETFKSQYPDMKVSYEAYRLRVKAKNISFASLGHEECEQCEEFNLHGHQKQDFQKNCIKCTSWKKHIDQARDSRELYQEYARNEFEDGTVCFSVDLQKVIMLPRVDTFKRIKATRGNLFLQSKSSLKGEFEKLDFLYKKAMKKSGILSQSVPYRTEHRGFPKIKKDAILKNLSDIMPENQKSFWINLPETNDD
ncbi:hypothetical protein JTB14_024279 [Gonioctena quinquepunctata]|nr:hypothetical protein JTB14_024279 [Gonioctena quinquepunctata]